MSALPKFVSQAHGGEGFAEIIATFLSLRD